METLRSLVAPKALFAVVDCCENPGVLPKLQELEEDTVISLFENTSQREYWAIAPYLVEVTPYLLESLLKSDFPEGWGIFVVAPLALQQLHQHLSGLQFVLLPDRKKWLFRYYDPDILADFLPTCNVDELRSFFGPVLAYIIVSKNGTFTSFAFSD